MLSPGPPFKVIILAYTVIGVGESLQNVQANAFVAALGSNTKLGILHASYGPCLSKVVEFTANVLTSLFDVIRDRSFCLAPDRHPVCTECSLVFPLACCSWTCHAKCYLRRMCVPNETSIWYNIFLFY